MCAVCGVIVSEADWAKHEASEVHRKRVKEQDDKDRQKKKDKK